MNANERTDRLAMSYALNLIMRIMLLLPDNCPIDGQIDMQLYIVYWTGRCICA